MAWTDIDAFTAEQLIDEDDLNYIRDNLRYLKGLDGVPTIESGLIIDNTDGDEYLLLPSLTTAERNALSAVNGMAIYNETTSALNAYQGGSWGLIGVTDHGSLAGLTDTADHAYALLHNGTRALSGAWDMGSQNLTNVNVDSGTIDGANITVGSSKTLNVSAGTLTLTNDQISGDKVEGGTIAAITINTLTLGGDVTGGGYDLDNIGHIGLGNQAANTAYGTYYSETITLGDNNWRYGVFTDILAYKTSADYDGAIVGGKFVASVTDSNTQNWIQAIGVCGVHAVVGTWGKEGAGGTITGMASLWAGTDFGGDANSPVTTKYYGLYVAAQTLVGNSKLIEDYGIWIGNQAGGATLNYAIYTNDGLVRFGDTTDLCAGVAVFYSWGAVFADDYHLFMQSDYSSYVAGLDSGYLDLGANTGIRMRVGASGVVFTMTAQSLVIGYATTFNGRIIMGGAGSYLNLLQTDVNSNDEGDVWYDASENTIKVCLGGASVDTLATTANIATHAALTATHGVAGAIVGTTDSQALTNKSYNGLTLTSTTGTFTLASSKTFTVSNTLTLTATDTATLAIGGGGTLGSAAYTASTDYVAKATFDAHTLLIAISDNLPVKLDVAASRMIGRAAAGNIVALAKADILTIINVTEGADVTGSNTPQNHATLHTNGTDDIQSSSTTQKGIVELATGGETNTGTSAVLAVTPDGLDDWTGSAQLATLGTVTSGTISTGAVLADVTMTLGSDVDGDIYYRSSNKLTRLAKGDDDQVLTLASGVPSWAAAGGAALSTDWKGNFNWDTSGYTTNEQDISALFSPTLALDVRRKYAVKLDLTTVEADGSFDELYIAVKERVDGTNYRAIDRKTVTKAQLAATSEPAIIIDIPATSEYIQITVQMKTALAGDATIYYAVVREHLE